MPDLSLFPQSAATPVDAELRDAYSIAAQAVLASKHNRPTFRLAEVRLRPEAQLHFLEAPHAAALSANRRFLEETVMVELAGQAAEQIKFTEARSTEAGAALRLLRSAAATPDEAEVAEAYLAVLLARARGVLRQCWAEVEIVALALLERGCLDAAELDHCLRCIEGIRSATLN